MKTRIRKLEEKDLKYLEHIEDYRAKIILKELQLNKEENKCIAYGVFIGFDTLIGFCSLSDADEFGSCEYWNIDSKAITELYILDIYKDDIEIYCDLINSILVENEDCNIFFDNSINLTFEYYDQLGFIELQDEVLVRLSLKEYDNIEYYNKED